MYIKKLTIKNFRAFDEDGITLQFNKGVNAIIGENNSGKSAVMDAIRIAYSTVTYKKDIFFTRADFHVSEDGNAADFALFDIYLEEVPTRLVEIWNPESVGGNTLGNRNRGKPTIIRHFRCNGCNVFGCIKRF